MVLRRGLRGIVCLILFIEAALVEEETRVCLFAGLEPVTGVLEWSTGVERWSGVLEWTTGVASGICLSYFLYGINNKNMYV